MTTSRHLIWRISLTTLTAFSLLFLFSFYGGGQAGRAQAATPDGTVYGEGGDGIYPIMLKLLRDDGSALTPDYGAYTQVDADDGIADFVGTAPNSYGADFAVTERPLTSAEAAMAQANGRSFAYVPFAADPVALLTLVPNDTYQSSTSIDGSQFCQHIPLTVTQVAQIFGFDLAQPLIKWNDARLSCSTPGTTPAAYPISRWANLDPTMENEALMSLLDSTTATQALFQAGLSRASGQGSALSTDTTPSEHWPYSGSTIPSGDSALIGKLVDINAESDAPSTTAALLSLGATAPISADWTGDPMGVPWNLPTAAVQNAASSFVYPTAAAAEATESDATLASTSNPVTNNLVTFNANPNDAAAYNNFLMLQSYFVVPTNGLSSDKAIALAQFIRFALGARGQSDIASLGAAPATPGMVAAGLKVAQQLDAEAYATPASANAVGGTTTTTSPAGSTTTTTASNGSNLGGTNASGTNATLTSLTGVSPFVTLAATGENPTALLVLGACLVVVGESLRRRAMRRGVRG